MGYYTKFDLTVIGQTEEDHEENLTDKYNDGYPLCDELNKWYNWEKNMKEYSLQYPDLVFKLEGYGEEIGDIWIAYFSNGKVQHCPAIITFDEFDEKKLK